MGRAKADRMTVKYVTLPFTPRPWQMPLMDDKSRAMVAVVHRRAGKALDVTTPIMTASGAFKAMGDLARGDIIFDESGELCHVTHAYPVMHGRPCYAVTFDDGQQIVCDEDHLWYTETKADRTTRVGRYVKGTGRGHKPVSGIQKRRPGTAKTTAVIRDTLRSRGESNHAIPFAGPLDFPDAVLPIDPYILGLWLGDGHSRTARFTTMDQEIVVGLKEYAEANDWRFSTIASKGGQGLARSYSVAGDSGHHETDSLTRRLRQIGLIKNKHIPAAYLRAGQRQRLELLRGIMDTDGSIDPRGGRRCEIAQKNGALATGIIALIRALGGNPRVAEKVVNGKVYHRITFSPAFNPFKLTRKASVFKLPGSAANRNAFGGMRRIVSVEPVESRPVRCITVDSPSHLYLAGEGLIPTHNSTAFIWRGLRKALTEDRRHLPLHRRNLKSDPPRVIHVLPGQVMWQRTGLWDKVARAAEMIPGAIAMKSVLRVELPNGGVYQCGGMDKPDSYRGSYADEVIEDEADDVIASGLDLVIEPMLSDYDGARIKIGTPKGNGRLAAAYDAAGHDPHASRYLLPYTETGALDDKQVQRLRETLDVEEFAQELECSFTSPNSGSYYGKWLDEVIRDNRVTRVTYDPKLPVFTSWDLGMDDSTAIWWFQRSPGGEWRWLEYHEDSGQGFDHYARLLHSKPYVYGKHYLPHDIEVRELSAGGKSRRTTLLGLGVKPIFVVPAANPADRVSAVRQILPRSWFDAKGCEVGLKRLRAYRRAWNEHMGVWRAEPVHDDASHGSDAIGTGVQGSSDPENAVNKPVVPPYVHRPIPPTSGGWASI